MKSLLDRLYRTKLTLLAVVCSVVGIGLMLLGAWAQFQPGIEWLNGLPVMEVGSALFTTGLIAIFFEFIDRQDAEERANERLRTVLSEEAPAIRDAVIDGFAFKPEALTNVASPAVLTKIVTNCLALQLDDPALANEAYADLREQLVGRQRCYDMDVSVTLSPWEGGPADGPGSMFVATMRWEYRTKLAQPAMRFSCVSSTEEYRELLGDPTSAAVVYFEPVGELDGKSKEVFELVSFSIDGEPRGARRTTRAGAQIFTVNLDETEDLEDEVVISYTYRQLVQRHGHLLHVDVGRPTRGLKVGFAYGDCGIRFVNVLDYVSRGDKARIERLPASGPAPSISVGFDGWVWPKAGVGFVWVLDEEMHGREPAMAKGSRRSD